MSKYNPCPSGKEIASLYKALLSVSGGLNAQYIPQLARVNPDFLGWYFTCLDTFVYSEYLAKGSEEWLTTNSYRKLRIPWLNSLLHG